MSCFKVLILLVLTVCVTTGVMFPLPTKKPSLNWVMGWNDTNVFLGFSGNVSTNDKVYYFFDTDPFPYPFYGNGISLHPSTSTILLPFRADRYVVVDTTVLIFIASGSSWVQLESVVIQNPANFTIPISALGMTTSAPFHFHAHVLTNSGETMNLTPPMSDDTDTITQYYGFASSQDVGAISPKNLSIFENHLSLYFGRGSSLPGYFNGIIPSGNVNVIVGDDLDLSNVGNLTLDNIIVLSGTITCSSSCAEIIHSFSISVTNAILADYNANPNFQYCAFNVNSTVTIGPLTQGAGPIIPRLFVGANGVLVSEDLSIQCTFEMYAGSQLSVSNINYLDGATIVYTGPSDHQIIATDIQFSPQSASNKILQIRANVLFQDDANNYTFVRVLMDDNSKFHWKTPNYMYVKTLIMSVSATLDMADAGNIIVSDTATIGSVTCQSTGTLYSGANQFNKIIVNDTFVTDSLPLKVSVNPSNKNYTITYPNSTSLQSNDFDIVLDEYGKYSISVFDNGCAANTIFHVISSAALTTVSLTTAGNSQDVSSPGGNTSKPLAAIIGGAAGGLIGIILLSLLIVFLIKRKKNKSDNNNNNNNETPLQDRKSFQRPVAIRDIKVGNKLGGGFFSDVYKGEWQGSTSVALKKLKSESQMNEFMSEAVLLQSLNHPHIVRFLGIYSTSTEKYIVTEFMTHGALNSFLQEKEGQLPKLTLIDMARQAAAGMKYLEANNVVHRDLALRNLLVTGGGDANNWIVKVGDLGLSRAVENTYYKSEGKQIPIKWSAPEVYLQGKSSSQSDVWSFGIVLWEIFSWGKIPYPAFTNEQVVEKVGEGYRMNPPAKMDDEVAQLMKRCWEHKPDMRPKFEEVHSTLQAIYKNCGGKDIEGTQKRVSNQVEISVNYENV